MAGWQFLTARVTLFPGALLDRRAADIFREIWSSEPDSFQSGPPGPIGLSSAATAVRDGVGVTVNVQPGRVDLSFGPIGGEIAAPVPFMNTQALVPAIDRLVDKLPNLPSNRIACFLTLGQICPDIVSANELIRSVMDSDYRPARLSDEFDFIFQVNHVTNSTVLPNLKYNLIIKFGVERLNTIFIPPQVPFVASSQSLGMMSREQIVSTVTVDYNNHPTSVSLQHDELLKVGRDLKKLAINAAAAYTNGTRE